MHDFITKELLKININGYYISLRVNPNVSYDDFLENEAVINGLYKTSLLNHENLTENELIEIIVSEAITAGGWVSYSCWYDDTSAEQIEGRIEKFAEFLDEQIKDGGLFSILAFVLGIGLADEEDAHKELTSFCKKVAKLYIEKDVAPVEVFKEMYKVGIILYHSKNADYWHKKPGIIKAKSYATDIIDEDKMAGLIPGAPIPAWMPEIYGEAERICNAAMDNIGQVMPTECDEYPANVLAFCLIYGMGMVYFCKAEGMDTSCVPDELIAVRGIDHCDEYIIDSVGIGFETDEGKAFCAHINEMIGGAYNVVYALPEESRAEQWQELYKAFFIYGMAYEIGRLKLSEYSYFDYDMKDEYIGNKVSFEDLIGRNFYLYTNGNKDKSQPFEINLSDLELDTESDDAGIEDEEMDEDESYFDNDLADYLPEECWVKRIGALEDGCEAYHLIAINIGATGHIKSIITILEEVQKMGSGWFVIPGMELESSRSYEEMDYCPDDVIEELELLTKHRFIPKDFNFVGKRLPQAMIDAGGNGGSNTNYTYALQSAYRLAYMHMSIDTNESGIIEGFNYSSYQSSGSSYGDLFSRPQRYSDRSDEAIDMLLYILDQYTEQEYKDVIQ